MIQNSAAIVDRLEQVIDALEVRLTRQSSEIVRLRRVEAAASAALADLDALMGETVAVDNEQRLHGNAA